MNADHDLVASVIEGMARADDDAVDAAIARIGSVAEASNVVIDLILCVLPSVRVNAQVPEGEPISVVHMATGSAEHGMDDDPVSVDAQTMYGAMMSYVSTGDKEAARKVLVLRPDMGPALVRVAALSLVAVMAGRLDLSAYELGERPW